MNRFSIWIQHILKNRGESIEKIALKAQIRPSTIRRWLQGDFLPRNDALSLFMDAIGGTEQEREEAWNALDRPRAIERSKSQNITTRFMPQYTPNEGDLWRALRLRSRLSQGKVARMSGFDKSLLSRWENSKRLPSPEDRVRLSLLYNMTGEERSWLLSPERILSAPLAETLRSFEDCAHALEDWEWFIGSSSGFIDDLYYIALEYALWNLLRTRKDALRLLIRAWTRHAEYLLWHGRLAEMGEYANRAWDAAHKVGMPPEEWWRAVVYCRARHCFFIEDKMQRDGAIRIFEESLSLFPNGSEQQGSLYCDMADVAVSLGQCGRAHIYLEKAKAIALQNDHRNVIKSHNMMLSRAYEAEKRFTEAMALWNEMPDLSTEQRIFTGLHKAEVYRLQNNKNNARLVLDDVFKEFEGRNIMAGRDLAEYLAGLL